MGFVADDEVPIGRGRNLRLQLVGPGHHVEPDDQPIALGERVAGERGLDLVARQDVEGEAEFLGHFVLPLLDQRARRDDEAALQIAPDQQLLDEQARHDGLAGAGIVGEQEAQRLPRQHLAIDRRDLMRQRLDLRRRDGDVGVEEIGEADAVGLGGKPKQAAVGVEGVGPAGLDELKADLFAAHDQPLADTTVDTEDDVERVRAELGDLDDLGEAGRVEAAKTAAGFDALEHCYFHIIFGTESSPDITGSASAWAD